MAQGNYSIAYLKHDVKILLPYYRDIAKISMHVIKAGMQMERETVLLP